MDREFLVVVALFLGKETATLAMEKRKARISRLAALYCILDCKYFIKKTMKVTMKKKKKMTRMLRSIPKR